MTTLLPMNDIIPDGLSQGVARVKHVEVSDHEAAWSSLRGSRLSPGRYVQLFVGGTLMMSDGTNERLTNYDIVHAAEGDVLIAGLGIGYILRPILAKPAVTSVTVVEKYQDVIDLIGPRFTDPRLSIVCADIFDWVPTKGQKFDVIYFDIWPDICTDNLPAMGKLHQRFKGRLKGKRWMNSWCREQLLAKKRQESRMGW